MERAIQKHVKPVDSDWRRRCTLHPTKGAGPFAGQLTELGTVAPAHTSFGPVAEMVWCWKLLLGVCASMYCGYANCRSAVERRYIAEVSFVFSAHYNY